ncbi:endothelin-converting enzyme 1 [Elysia marginata]|uniref:Endothelin-converting enzyme 1 n=1 Tax=Elysia marginata TaxID=1093978 RepID=A0AAV4ETL5_9GAST|nr:endothelin-converting enzyme 1 [Elysia marginata]
MPVREYFLDEIASARRTVYRKYMYDVAVMLGADTDTAHRDVEDMMQFEIELAKITIPTAQRRDNQEMYNKMTVGKLQQLVPEFEWLVCLQRLFSHVGISITDQEPLVVYAPSYLAGLGRLYKTTDNRVIVNYLLWRLMMNWVNNLPTKYRNIKNDYIKNIFGSQADPPRWSECVDFVNVKMGNALGRLFVEEHFDESSKDTADAISEKIGYADSILVDDLLDKEYQEVDYYPDRYVDNIITFLKHTARSKLRNLRIPVDRTKWSTTTTPAVVNAFYSATKNQIMFPAGILQPPFYSKHFPKYLNYGGIGMVIGHEITHGFDDRGRQYDKDGNLVKWWDDIVIHRFKERAQCIIDQYSNYTVPEINMSVNGLQTQGENIADNGGIKEAYRAYRKYVERQHIEEKRLPGLLQFSGDQLFFINFAQKEKGDKREDVDDEDEEGEDDVDDDDYDYDDGDDDNDMMMMMMMMVMMKRRRRMTSVVRCYAAPGSHQQNHDWSAQSRQI